MAGEVDDEVAGGMMPRADALRSCNVEIVREGPGGLGIERLHLVATQDPIAVFGVPEHNTHLIARAAAGKVKLMKTRQPLPQEHGKRPSCLNLHFPEHVDLRKVGRGKLALQALQDGKLVLDDGGTCRRDRNVHDPFDPGAARLRCHPGRVVALAVLGEKNADFLRTAPARPRPRRAPATAACAGPSRNARTAWKYCPRVMDGACRPAGASRNERRPVGSR